MTEITGWLPQDVLKDLAKLKLVSRTLITQQGGNGRFKRIAEISRGTEKNGIIGLTFKAVQHVYTGTRFSLSGLACIEQRKIDLKIDCASGHGTGTDSLNLVNPAPDVTTGSLDILPFDLSGRVRHLTHDPKMPHTQSDNLSGVLQVIAETLLKPTKGYNQATFVAEVRGRSTGFKWPEGMTTTLEITFKAGQKMTPRQLYGTLQKLLKAFPSTA